MDDVAEQGADPLVAVATDEVRAMAAAVESGVPAGNGDQSSPAQLVEALLELSELLLDDTHLEEAVTTILSVALRTLGSNGHAVTLTVSEPEQPSRTFATRDATAPWARTLDEWQYEHGEGPCLAADQTGATCVVRDCARDERFPGFAAQALAAGIRSCVSHPMLVRGRSLGSINVFHPEPDAPTPEIVDAGEQLARASAPLLANWMAHRRVSRLAAQLEEALDGRAVIERAKGVLMAELGIDADQAFELLRSQSNHEHRKLREVAGALLASRER